MKQQRAPQEFDEKVIKIGRVSKKTKGGNHVSFTALVVVGDRKSRVGVALGKASDVMHAIQKGVKKAKKHLITVPLHGTTLPHELMIKFGAAKVVLKPAPVGTGVIAGGSVRSVLELAGLKDVVAKSLGTSNRLSNVNATFRALEKMASVVAVKRALGQMPSAKEKQK
ncbi:MAG: 30S ribosomal protein S5 [bacterium]